MLSVHGLVKVLEALAVRELFPGKWLLQMKIGSQETDFNGEKIVHVYPAQMFFSKVELANQWAANLTVGRLLIIKHAGLKGVKQNTNKGYVELRLYPDERFTELA